MSKGGSEFPVQLLATVCLWTSIITVPLILTHDDTYKIIFHESWYDDAPRDYRQASAGTRPSPLGLSLGLLAVAVGQVFTLIYFSLWKHGFLGSLHAIQKAGAPAYVFLTSLREHLSQPEGFLMLGGYLCLYWLSGLMPASYYSFAGGINWVHVFAQLLIQDALQYVMHRLEHDVHPYFYQISHKPHHRFTNPKLFDAFNGSTADTFCMILVPLLITSRLVNANVWSYMTFGSLYANWLTLIHSEYTHPWDRVFRAIGFGSAADHHVHHKLFKFNFGHLFM